MNDIKTTVQDVLIEPVFSDLYNFSELIVRVSYDGTILDFTTKNTHDLYIPANYFIGRRIRDILPEKIHHKFEGAVLQALQKNSVKIFEYSIRINNIVKYYKAKFFPSVNKQVIIIINEVTKSKKAVKALKESESKLRTIWENSRDGMRLIDKKGIIIAVNNAFCSMFGMTEKELVGKPFNIVYKKQSSGNIDESHKLFQQRFTSHAIENFLELKVVLKEGEELTLEIVNTFIEDTSAGSNNDQEGLLLSIFRDITEKKKSEEARASLAAIVDSSNDAIIGCTLNGIIINWNNAAEKLYNFTGQEIKGQSFLRIFPEISPAGFRKILSKIRQNILLEHYETRAAKKDGSLFYTSVTISPIKSSGDTISGFSAIVRDITDKKKSVEVLQESEERYRTLIETSPDAIAMFDLEGKLLMGNIQVANTFGFNNTEEFTSEDIFTLVGEENREKILADSGSLIEQGTLKNIEYVLVKKDGSSFSAEISASVINDASGLPKAVICIFRDITERKQSVQALKRSEEQFRSVWENSSEGMRLSDSEGRIVAVNKAFCKLTGLTEQAIIGRYFNELYNENAADEKARYKNIFLNVQGSKSHQAQFNFISGKVLDLVITYSLITETDKPLVLSIFHDITDAKRSERELRKSEKLAAIGKMAAYLAHEIKTPLASIKINIDMMSKTLSLPKDKQRSFEIIQKEVKRLHLLLKNVLQFSRQVDLVFMDINLYKLINSIRLLFGPILNNNQIVFVNRIREDIAIIGDHQKLQTVFSHLIENAVEAMPRRGRIEIYSTPLNDKEVEIFIKDDGGGIKDPNQVFEPFFTTKSSGTGLGLAIAKKVIEQHEGSIQIHTSVPGETIFKIILKMSRKKIYGDYPNNR